MYQSTSEYIANADADEFAQGKTLSEITAEANAAHENYENTLTTNALADNISARVYWYAYAKRLDFLAQWRNA